MRGDVAGSYPVLRGGCESFVTWTGGWVEPAGVLGRGARQPRVSVKNGRGLGDQMAGRALLGTLALRRGSNFSVSVARLTGCEDHTLTLHKECHRLACRSAGFPGGRQSSHPAKEKLRQEGPLF